MHPRPLLAALTAALVLPLAGAPATAEPQARGEGEHRRALRALERVEALFDGEREGRRPDRDATLALLELTGSLDALEGRELRRAETVLARPTGDFQTALESSVRYTTRPKKDCGPEVCVWWETGTRNAPPGADTTGVPSQVTRTRTAFETAWQTLVVEQGYRAPLDDSDSPKSKGRPELDVYLADIGAEGYYGYCASDDPDRDSSRKVSAYCVVDDDYSTTQFSGSRQANLEVTAAHEFFHAVQFAYDYREYNQAPWFVEGSATWAEDVVFDEHDDNHRYLPYGQLARPGRPLDRSGGLPVYGSWLFWQFLTEHLGVGGTADNRVVREIWLRTQGTRDALTATRDVLTGRGTSLVDAYAHFGVANRAPATFYDEGAGFDRTAPLAGRSTLSDSSRTSSRSAELDHLSTAHFQFRPAGTIEGRRRLRVVVDLTARRRGSAATLLVRRADGELLVKRIRLDYTGAGSVRVGFTPSAVRAVDVVLGNAGSRDDQVARVTGRLVS